MEAMQFSEEIKRDPYVYNLLNTILLLLHALAIIKILGHSKLDSLEVKRNHLADTSQAMLPLKEPVRVKYLSWSKILFPQMIRKAGKISPTLDFRKLIKRWKIKQMLI